MMEMEMRDRMNIGVSVIEIMVHVEEASDGSRVLRHRWQPVDLDL